MKQKYQFVVSFSKYGEAGAMARYQLNGKVVVKYFGGQTPEKDAYEWVIRQRIKHGLAPTRKFAKYRTTRRYFPIGVSYDKRTNSIIGYGNLVKGKHAKRAFSIRKYGREEALQRAVEFRNEIIERIKLL